MGYDIKRVKANAARLGVDVRKSRAKGKKIDVIRSGKVVASVGAIGYDDFTKHRDEKRKKNYKKRFEKTRHKKGTASYYADQLLWT